MQGDALLRIGEVLRFNTVSHKIGWGGDTLSFQKGYFPVFQVCSTCVAL